MVYVNGHFIYGAREVKYTETYVNKNSVSEVFASFVNWPDTCEYDVSVELYEGSLLGEKEDTYYYKIQGPIKDMLQFIYKYVLQHGDCSIEEILQDKNELDMIMDVYLQKLW